MADRVSLIEDWHAVIEAAERHRVVTLVFLALRQQQGVPAGVLAELSKATKQKRLIGLAQLAELGRIGQLLSLHAIPFAELKGFSLGQLAYGKTDVKESVDIDVLVPKRSVYDAVDALFSSGYSLCRTGSKASPRQVHALVDLRKDVALCRGSNLKLELHWRLTSTSGLLPESIEPSDWRDVTIGRNLTLQTLAMPDLLAYLAVHGALHSWSRLKWLSDFNALLNRMQREEWQAAIEREQHPGAGEAIRLALQLCDLVFDSRRLQSMRGLSCDPQLVSHSIAEMQKPSVRAGTTTRKRMKQVINNWKVHSRLFENNYDRLSLTRNHLYCERDLMMIPLPRSFRFMYAILRLPLWFAARLKLVSPKKIDHDTSNK
ncbi:MAG: nucleotidyltransferase family protein [Pseudomonadota bacterium]